MKSFILPLIISMLICIEARGQEVTIDKISVTIIDTTYMSIVFDSLHTIMYDTSYTHVYDTLSHVYTHIDTTFDTTHVIIYSGKFVSIPQDIYDDPVYTSLTVSWQPNVEYDMSGYRLYIGDTPNIFTTMLDVGNVTRCVVHVLSHVNKYFTVTAYDLAGNESEKPDWIIYKEEE